jgi:hypothetical protein
VRWSDLTGTGDDEPDIPFYVEALPRIALDPRGNKAALSRIEPVVFVRRLREVMALIGFNRYEPASTDAKGFRDDGPSVDEVAKGRSGSTPAV